MGGSWGREGRREGGCYVLFSFIGFGHFFVGGKLVMRVRVRAFGDVVFLVWIGMG